LRRPPNPGSYWPDPSTPPTQAGEPYSVFSRFFGAWRELERRPLHPAPERIAPPPDGLESGAVPDGDDLGLGPDVPDPVRQPGEPAARAALRRWLQEGIAHYHERQNGIARLGTSVLSPYLRWGCLSPRECEERARAEERAREQGSKGAGSWVRQLAWRDFYAHTLLLHPSNVRAEQQERFRGLARDDDPDRLAAWAEGRTGYPLVDAGMRQLAIRGWMHNRVRLVVGSFLTKELHLDWRAGEDHFARLLLDGEPAQNNGNWQWIAGTGTDPAPYFRRMYNPALHQERFDPNGDYVRKWVPEVGTPGYPEPIVDRKVERERAAERYRAALGF